jgi:phosphoribosylformylglycinamidine synthase
MAARILILHASGTNRDAEAARGVQVAGGAPEIVHINQLRYGERTLGEYALDLQVYFADALHSFVESGRPVLGICNGFQTLVKAGLLPQVAPGATRRVTLTENASGHFECRWVHLAVNPTCKATWLHPMEELIFCPVAHGEGNVQVADAATADALDSGGLVAFRYVDAQGECARGRYPLNPNGSVGDIAGLCNAQGNVVGLMPHPEDHILPIQNPLGARDGAQQGLLLFQRFVDAARA